MEYKSFSKQRSLLMPTKAQIRVNTFLEILASTYGPGHMLQDLSINNLKQYYKTKCAPGALFECTLLQEHICYMLLEQ